MAEIKKTDSSVKPVATIKTPVAAADTKKPEVKTAAPAAKAEAKAEVKAEKKPAAKKPAAKKPAAKKPAVKKAEPKKTEAKAEKKTAAKAETKKAAPKKAAAKKPAAKKTAAKKPAEAKTADVKANVVLQYGDKNVTYDTIVQNSRNNFQFEMGGNVDDIKKLSIYVKPSEDAAYYVVNDKVQGRIGL